MKIDIYQPITVEIDSTWDKDTYEDINTAIVSVGGIEVYRESAGYLPDPGSYDYEEYCNSAKDRALRPLADFLKKNM